ncbi:MAG: ATP-grasp domain-containing protein [Ruminococcus sp.]|nr:ATP-grasp domain-containing protein [Ruminococcus sp.]
MSKEFDKKRLLVLGGSRISCQIVKKAQEMGAYVLVTDWYTLEKSPAKQIADEACFVSTSDLDAMENLIREKHIDGIVTGFTDSVLPYYADICERVGLPCYGTRKQFEQMTDKTQYKALCRQFGVPTIDSYDIDFRKRTSEWDSIRYPVMVKPADSSGARGVLICENEKELVKAYEEAEKISESKKVLVERFVNTGKEATIFWVFQDGNIMISGFGNRHVKKVQEDAIALPVAYSYPSNLLPHYQETVFPKVEKMLKSIGIKNGMMFMQCMVEDGECLVYDIGYRLTGSLEYLNMERIGGYNPLEMLIRFAFTGKMAEYDLRKVINPNWKTYGSNISFLMKPGTIGKITGIEEIRKMDGVIDAVLARHEGETLPPEGKGQLRQIMLRVLGEAPNKEALWEQLHNVYNALKVMSPDGENLLLPGLDKSDLDGTI